MLIVTKARDNRLIKLTRELALYLMCRKAGSIDRNDRNDDRKMVVYVDSQLRASKRFDAAGMQRDYPDLFAPVMRRRSSSSASLSAMSTYSSSTNVSDLARGKREDGQLRYWTSEMCSNSPHLFDFVVTVSTETGLPKKAHVQARRGRHSSLHLLAIVSCTESSVVSSRHSQKIVPPVLPFALGSLGFLTNFDFAQYRQTMDRCIDDGIRVNLRMRFTCTVYRAIATEISSTKDFRRRKAFKKPGGEIMMSCVDNRGWEALEAPSGYVAEMGREDKEIMCFTTRPVEQFEVLNDLVVDRGPSPYVSLLELFGEFDIKLGDN